MAFNFAAFFSGAAEQVAENLQEAEKEERTALKNEFDNLQKKALEEEKNIISKRDKLKSTAKVLSSYKGKNNVGFTEGQLVALLQNPEQADRVQKALTAAEGRLDQIDFTDLVTIAKGKTNKTVDQYIKESTTPSVSSAKIAPQERKLFGFTLPGSEAAFQREVSRQERAKGATYGQLKGTAAGLPEPAREVEVDVDMRKLAKPESIDNVRARLRDNLADGQKVESSPENVRLFEQLEQDAILRATIKNRTEGDSGSPRTTSAIRSTFKDAIEGAVTPWILGGKLILNKDTGEYSLTTGDPKDVEEFIKLKNSVVKNTVDQMGLTDKDGKIYGFKRNADGQIIGGRESYDALIRYADISYDGRILGWKGMEGMPKGNGPAKGSSGATGTDAEGDAMLPKQGAAPAAPQPKPAPAPTVAPAPTATAAPTKATTPPAAAPASAPTKAAAPATQPVSVMRQAQPAQPVGFTTPMGTAAGATPRPKTRAEYDAIPRGTRYFAQDGTLRVKK